MNYKITGTPNSPVLIFSNSLGSEMGMWDELVPYLLPYFRVLQYDTRGHGGSKNPQEKDGYTIELLSKDIIDLMDELQIETAYFCGLSMGGLIGQYLGINYPNRFIKLVLSNTGAKIGTEERWNERRETISKSGMQAIVDDTMERWFTDKFRKDNPEKTEKCRKMFLNSDVQGYSNCCCAIRDADFRENLKNISVVTLVLTGSEDPVTNIAQAEFLVENIPHARLQVLEARHLSAIELPKIYASVLIGFFIGTNAFAKGMHVRKTVLGQAHVANANRAINDFNADFQKFITQYAWGEIWTREGLSKPTKSLITLAMLIALNRPAEFKLHVKAAFNNGLTLNEIKEVIMQSAIYCGLPAANDAFHLAMQVFNENDIKL